MASKESATVIMFPGQGSQAKGMGRDLFMDYSSLTDQASEVLGYSISELCLQDPDNKLALTQFTQPALYVVNALAYLKFSQGRSEKINFFLGHSLGEYNALFAAGAYDFITGLKLVKLRAELMAGAGSGGMAAVIGMSEAGVLNLLNTHPEFQLAIANYNSPEQFVLSGSLQQIQDAKSLFEKNGVRAYIPIKVSGAFHSPYMKHASESFAKYLGNTAFGSLHTPVIANVSASPYEGDEIALNLAEQIFKPVKWTQSIAYLRACGINNYVEVGPGKVLSKLQKDIYKNLPQIAEHSSELNIGKTGLESIRKDNHLVEDQFTPFKNTEIRHKFENIKTLRQFVEAFDESKFSLNAVTQYRGEPELSLSYGELKEKVRCLGSALLSIGVKKGDRVGLLAENRTEWPLTYLAVASIGAVIVPLDIFLGEGELGNVIENSNISYCFCSENYLERIALITECMPSFKKIVCFDKHLLLLEAHEKSYTAELSTLAETLDVIRNKELSKTNPFDSRKFLHAADLIKLGEKKLSSGDQKYNLSVPDGEDIAAAIYMTENRFAELSHAGIMANLYGILDVLDEDGKYLRVGESSLAVLPFHHTFPTMGGFLLPLASYLEIVLLPRFTAKRFVEAVKTRNINYSVVVPYLLESIDKELTKTKATLDSMKFIFIGGASVKKSVLTSMEAKGCKVVQGYGLTEFSPVVTVNIPGQNCLGSIGKPIPGVTTRIINGKAGDHGELWVHGPSLMKGYAGLDAETQAIVENGWLKTGDIAYQDSEGFLFISGRKKPIVVNSGGKNIYPREIEKLLQREQCIKSINIFPWIDAIEGECPHAILYPDYIVIEQLESELGKTLDTEEISDFLIKKIDQATADIPNYKVPKHIFIAQRDGSLPEGCPPLPSENKPFMFIDYYLNSNAADVRPQPIDKDDLDDGMRTITINQQTSRVRDFINNQINLVCDRNADFGNDDALDELDSVVKLKLKFNIEKILDTRIAISLLAKCQSVDELTMRICNEKQFVDVMNRILQLKVNDTAEIDNDSPSVFNLTEMQQAFWVSKHFSRGKDEVGCHIYLEIEEADLDYERLKVAWSTLSKAHRMLHAKIIDESQQMLMPVPDDFDFACHDLRSAKEESVTRHIHNRRDVLQQKFYSSDDWPLYTIEITYLPDSKSIIHFSIDEWIVDGMSLWILLRQWYQLYKNADSSALPGLHGFNDYQAALHSSHVFSANDADSQYWLTKLADMPEAPLTKQRQAVSVDTGFIRERLSRTISQQHWVKLTNYCQKINISPTALLLSAFNEILTAYSNCEKFSLILTFFNRKPVVPNVELIVGPFISTNIYIHHQNNNEPIERIIRGAQDQLWSDMDHSNFGAIRSLRELKNRKLINNDVVLPVVFTSMLANTDTDDGKEPGWLSRVGYSVTQTPGVYLDHQTFVLNNTLCISWDYANGYFAKDLMVEMINAYAELLDSMAMGVDSLNELTFSKLRKSIASNHQHPVKLDSNEESRFSPYPLSPIQQSYFLSQIGFASDKKNNCLVYQEIEFDSVSADVIVDAWHVLVDQHDVLRTVITSDGQQQVKSVLTNVGIEHVDLSGFDKDQIVRKRLSIRQTMQDLFFSIDEGPFWQVRISSTTRQSHCFHIAIDMLLCDANSMQLLFKQLITLIQGNNPYFSKLRYRDVLLHQQSDVDSNDKNLSQVYWRSKFEKMYPGPCLSEVNEFKEISSSMPRQRFEGELKEWPNLISHANELNVPVSSVILTIYAETILAWTKNIPFTLVVVNWDRPAIHEVAQIVGDFTQISWIQVEKCNLPFSQKVLALHQQLTNDLKHKNGLGELGRFVAKSKSSVAANLSVVFTNFMLHGNHTMPANIKFSYGLSQTPGVTLDNISVELDGVLHFHWDADINVHSPALISNMFSGYSRLMTALATETSVEKGIWISADMDKFLGVNESASTNKPVARQDYLKTEGDRKITTHHANQIKAWNNTHVDYPLQECLHYLIEDQVRRSPYRISMQFAQDTLSFLELNQRANQLARYMITQGLKPGAVVALVQERSVELLVSLLAILKAGAAYLPIDTNFPEERISYILRDASAALVLTHSKFAQRLPAMPCPLVLLDTCEENLEQFSNENLERTQSSDSLAYIIYTSGSTGNPKGCMITHSAIVNRLLWMKEEYEVDERDRILQKTPYTFDVSVWEFFLPLLSGATLVFAKPKGHQDPGYLTEIIREEKVTVCHFVPSMLNAFLNEPSVSQCTSLSRVFTSGEALAYGSVKKFLSLLNCNLHNLYGPTEAAVDVSYWYCQLNPENRVFIGKPVANTQLYIVNSELELVPPGEPGEILIGGVQVGKGYLAQENLTAEKFIPNHFSGKSGERLYRTGDLARQNIDGNIEYLGRRDSQVKLRGLRIELGEIETRLCEIDTVRSAIVRVRDENTDDPKLVAWLVSTDKKIANDTLTLKFVRQEMKKFLPEYMLPNAIVILDHLPTTEHGKLNEKALVWPVSALEKVNIEETLSKEKSVQEIEALLSKILMDTMNIQEIKSTDDLFDMGATSLTLVKLAQKVKQSEGIEIPVEIFLENPTIAGISSYVANKLNAGRTAIPVFNKSETGGSTISSHNSVTNNRVELLRHNFNQNTLSRILSPSLWMDEQFKSATISFNELSSLLSLLAQRDVEGRPRYRYPSGGGKNAVQVYIYVNSGCVESLAGGFYYYHPVANHLIKLPSEQKLSKEIFNKSYNNTFETSSFTVFLVAEYSAIEPFYADASTTLVELDVGYITQLLQQNAGFYNLSLLAVDDVAYIQCKENFLLSESQQFVSCLMGGGRSVKTGLAQEGNADFSFIPSDNLLQAGHLLRSLDDIERANTDGRYSTLSKEEQAAITAEARHLRNDLEHLPAIQLHSTVVNNADYVLRACQREYKQSGLTLAQLGKLMSLLQNLADAPQQKIYSADALPHQVDAYVLIKSGGVQDKSIAGLYRYDDRKNCLEQIVVDVEALENDIKSAHVPFNRSHYQKSKVNVFLIGNINKTKDSFGNYGIRKAYIEAGKIGQLMMQHQSELGLGVCPIGGMRFDKIRHYFDLGHNQLFLHCMLIGAWDHNGNISLPIFSENTPPLTLPSMQNADEKAKTNQKLAVIGVSGRYPQADSLEEYWQLLKNGESAISKIPEDRWDAELYVSREAGDKKSYSKWGGFLNNVQRFDSLLFKISPSEAKIIDPQERLFLEIIWECLENAGYTAQTLKASAGKVGVFVGVMWSDYQSVATQGWSEGKIQQALSFHSSIANRVSHFFDFEGPSLAIDSSCSSALSAMHLARQSIATGECDAAIVGGINLIAHPYHQNILCGLNLLSQSEVCSAFGENGTGWVVGEGVGAVLVRPEESAQRARDNIHANILATSISHSGSTLRYGFPSAEKQAKSIKACFEQANVRPQDISYIESAATGSGLADSVEAEAIKISFAETITNPIAIGSVKPNVGHLESASFMSQLTKVLLQLQHGKIAPSINSEPRNPLINYPSSSFYINTELKDWTQRKMPSGHVKRMALINSFGATGSSGHVIVEEALRVANDWERDIAVVIPLSAQSWHQLILISRALLQFINSSPTGRRLADIAFTLQEGRVAQKQRIAFVVNSMGQLRESLESFINNSTTSTLAGSAIFGFLSQTNSDAQLHSLATRWMNNESVDWSSVQRGTEHRIALPTYPFNQENHWLDTDLQVEAGRQSNEPGKFSRGDEPMVNSNYSDKGINGTDAKLLKETQAWLRAMYASLSGISESIIDVDTSLIDYGINSVIIKSINAEIDNHFNNVSKTIMFECQTISDLATYLVSKHHPELIKLFKVENVYLNAVNPVLSSASTHINTGIEPRVGINRDIAVIGMAGRYPQAGNLEEFWNNLCAGKDCITEVPEERWNVQDFAMKNRWGGFIRDVDKFDPLFFNISPTEAKIMDPQERQFLEVAWESVENAGYTRDDLQHRLKGRVGVFVGVMYNEYQLFAAEEIAKGNRISLGNSIGSIANRVSYVLNLKGPSMAVDTLCSSSLTAAHLAVQSMKSGECDAAIVGGVNLSLHPSKYLMHAQMNMTSSNGRCSAFSDQGDGMVAGEGVGSIVIKWLDSALADGDQIFGVIKATSVNHDGKTNGYTVPNPVQQGELIRSALNDAKVDAAHISYIEAHGTGTALGDPIEINGLARAFQDYSDKKQFCAVGSVKSNIGHLEAASGVASISKVLLQMRHKKLVPSLHTQTLNRNIQFEETPFYIQRELSEWLPKNTSLKEGSTGTRLAGISSFGAGGANAHIILEEFETDLRAEHQAPALTSEQNKTEQLFVLSAKNKLRLTEYVNKWIALLEQHDVDLSENQFANLLYTSQIGREAMPERVAILADTSTKLLQSLHEFNNQNSSENVFTGNATSDKSSFGSIVSGDEARELIDVLIRHRNLTKLAKLWVSGIAIDWHNLHQGERRQRVSIPTYPFVRESYWLPQSNVPINGMSNVININQKDVAPLTLHPLLDQYRASLSAISFSKLFTSQSAWINQLSDNNHYSIGGAVILEMLHAAANHVAEEKRLTTIRHLHWAEPKIPNNTSYELLLKLYTKPDNPVVQCVLSAQEQRADNAKDVALAELVFASPDNIRFIDGYVDYQLIKSRCENNLSAVVIPPVLREFNFSQHEAIVRIECCEEKAVTSFDLNHSTRLSQEFLASPALLKNALLAAAMFHGQLNNIASSKLIPISVLQVDIHRKISDKCHLHIIRSTASELAPDDIAYDIVMIDGAGRQAISLRGVTFTQISSAEHGLGESAVILDSQLNISQLEYNKTEWFERQIKSVDSVSGTTLIFDNDDRLCTLLREKSKDDLYLIKAGKSFKKITWGNGQDGFQIDSGNGEHYEKVLAEFAKKDSGTLNIIHNWSKKKFNDGSNTTEQLHNGISSLNQIAKQVVKFSRRVKMLYLFEGNDIQPCYEACGVFLKTLSYENPKVSVKTLAVTGDVNVVAQQSINELSEFSMHDYEIRYDGDKRKVKHYLPCPQTSIPAVDSGLGNSVLRKNGVYLITGGMGGLGLLFAKYLSQHYQARLVLTGRRLRDKGMDEQLKQLQQLGGEVVYLSCNVSDEQQLEDCRALCLQTFGELNGVVHAAGVLKNGLIANKIGNETSEVLEPKVDGTMTLDKVFAKEHLDFFVYFSSIIGVMGNIGQSDYAYANGFQNHYARYRNTLVAAGKRYGRSLSINWPLWQNGGMSADAQTEVWMEDSLGFVSLSSRLGLLAFEEILNSKLEQVIVLSGFPNKINETLGIHEREMPSRYDAVRLTQCRTFVKTDVATHPNVHDIEKNSAAKETNYPDVAAGISQFLREKIAEATGVDENKIDDTVEFWELGLDSILSMKIIEKIEAQWGLRLYPNEMLEYNNVQKLSAYLKNEIDARPVAETARHIAEIDSITHEVAQAGEPDTGKFESRAELLPFLKRQVAASTGVDETQIDINVEFWELGLDSILSMKIIENIEHVYGIRLYPNEMLEYNTLHKLEAYLSAELAESLKSKSVIDDSQDSSNTDNFEKTPSSNPESQAGVAPEFDWKIQVTYISPATEVKKHTKKKIIFVLSTPRSGSTLFRVMLAGHSGIFSPPELHLLPYDTLDHWSNRLIDLNQKHIKEGLTKAIAELESLNAEAAIKRLDRLQQEGFTIKQTYELLLEKAQGRFVIDKSPNHALDLNTLRNAESVCDEPLYIHLVRHPLSVMESFVRNRFAKMFGVNENPWEYSGNLWRDMNNNILEHLSQVPSSRSRLIRYEDLVAHPENIMRSLCSWLELPFEMEMLKPYEGNKMTDGLREASLSIGDPNFNQHRKIESHFADNWKHHADKINYLNPAAVALAQEFGYLVDDAPEAEKRVITQIS
ncbi:MAG TPA: ACP S-malonyltransferase [Cellvibrio sp.]|nr:ACP S-malonyltransferase [Cellvibrio sp.]